VGFVKYKAHERRNGGCSSDRARKLLVVAKGWQVYMDKKKKKSFYTRAQRMDQEIGFCGTKALLFCSVEDSNVQDCKKIIIKYPLNLRNFLFSEKMFNL